MSTPAQQVIVLCDSLQRAVNAFIDEWDASPDVVSLALHQIARTYEDQMLAQIGEMDEGEQNIG